MPNEEIGDCRLPIEKWGKVIRLAGPYTGRLNEDAAVTEGNLTLALQHGDVAAVVVVARGGGLEAG